MLTQRAWRGAGLIAPAAVIVAIVALTRRMLPAVTQPANAEGDLA